MNYVLNLDENTLNIIASLLVKGPYEQVAPILSNINAQVVGQIKKPESEETEE